MSQDIPDSFLGCRKLVWSSPRWSSRVGEVAPAYGVSRSWINELLACYRTEGDTAFEPRSRRPRRSPTAIDPSIVELIIGLRRGSTDRGLDAGPDTIRWHLEHHQLTVSRPTIHRTLTRAGLVTPSPNKRPRSSYVRVEPNNPTNVGNPTSPTTHSRMGPTPRSSPGSTTTPVTPCPSPHTVALPDPSS